MKLPKKLSKSTKKYKKMFAKRWRHLRRQKKQQTRYLIIGAIVLVAVVALAGYVLTKSIQDAPTKRLVTFHDRGKDHVILTDASSVWQALNDAKITISPGDVVEPAIDSDLLTTDSAVIVYRARPVLIVDGALKQKIITAAAAPNELLTVANMNQLEPDDKASITEGNIVIDGATAVLTIERANPAPVSKLVFAPGPNALSRSKGAQLFVDGNGVAHRETYYDLPMNIVIGACGPGDYTIRYDGAKIDKDGYVLVAASYRNYPKCSVVETSMGPGKVYDTGGFALRYPHGFDLATDWTNYNGR